MDIKAFFETFIDHVRHAVITPGGFAAYPERGVRAVAFVKQGYTAFEAPQQRPERPGRRYVCDDVESFANCIINFPDFNEETTEILGRDGTMRAIDKVAHERDEIVLELDHDDAWEFWAGQNDKEFTIAELRRLLSARRNDLHTKGVGAALQEVAVTINDGAEVRVDPKTNLVVYKGQKKTVDVSGSVPDSFTLAIPVYVGQPAQQVVIDLVPRLDAKAEDAEQRLKLTLRILDPDAVKRIAWEERVAKVRELLGEAWLVGLGAIDFEK